MTSEQTLRDILAPTPATTAKPERPNLLQHLVAAGHVTEDGISRAAKIRTCQRCRAPVINGLDADRAAMVATCDPYPLTSLGQMLASIAGHRLYELWRGRDRYELEPRDADRIGYYIPTGQGGHHRIDILRAHHCHTRTPQAPELAISSFARPEADHGDQPNF